MSDPGRSALLAGAAIVCLAASAVRAESLADAIALAYRSNPTLQAQRALQRATDEDVVAARAGLRPSVGLSVGAGYSDTETNLSSPSHIESNSGGATLSVTQPLFNGGRTTAAVNAAEATVRAGREALRSTEASILQSVVQAYTDVRRDQQIVAIRRENVRVLANQVEESRAKFEVGQITRTDVAQSEAQLAAARALLSSAQAQLQISRANYTAVVGQNPGELEPEPPIPGVPASVDQAFDVGEAESPLLRRARSTEEASRARIAEAKAANHPTVSLQGSLGYSGRVSPFDPADYNRAVTAQAVVSQPLFTGGLNASNIRAATEQNTADRLNIEAARRQVVLQVSQAWNVMASSRANVTSHEEQVRAARVAFEGAQEEYRVGLRTTLDVLIAQQNLRDAELALVEARHDVYVAEAGLLNAMGRLEARYLVSGVEGYDAAAHLERVDRNGATPWDPLVARLDSLGVPRVAPDSATIRPLPPGGVPAMLPAGAPMPAAPPLSTSQPTGQPR